MVHFLIFRKCTVLPIYKNPLEGVNETNSSYINIDLNKCQMEKQYSNKLINKKAPSLLEGGKHSLMRWKCYVMEVDDYVSLYKNPLGGLTKLI